jgi:UDP-glucose 4-epimerase
MAGRFLVTGGAGYVGSHVVRALLRRGDKVVVLDNLSTGHRGAVHTPAELIVGDLASETLLDEVLSNGPWDAVLHFAALSLVGESMRNPCYYLSTNIGNGLRLIDACVRHNVKRFVLSSTANVYGDPLPVPITESATIDPYSPYGESKRVIERALLWADRLHGMRSACLRYFNAAGADPTGDIGEQHDPETHLIPLVIEWALGRRPSFSIYGTDYPTEDGTCIRDYIHVNDLADAHLCALAFLDTQSEVFNLGNGRGYTVREIVASVSRLVGRSLEPSVAPRRAGDPPVLVASSERIMRMTGWKPQFPEIDDIIKTAFAWHETHPQGYGDR